MENCENCKHGINCKPASDEVIWRSLDIGELHPCQGCMRNQPYPDNWEPVESHKPNADLTGKQKPEKGAF